jgi:TolA-binding protein
MVRPDRCCLLVILVFLVSGVVLSAPAGLADTKDEKDGDPADRGPATLPGIGLSLERTRFLSFEERHGAVQGVARSMIDFLQGDVPKEKRCAAHFLSGEIHYALGDYGRAAEDFKNAGKNDGQKIYTDDAAAAYIMALEAAGRDEEAAREWIKWDKKYTESPFRPEVLLARSWNALRRDARTEAVRTLDELISGYSWMEKDPRVVLAYAVVAYLEGRNEDVIKALSGVNDDAAVVYLRALGYEAQGAMLKAAAQYREVIERYPHSKLRDPAMLSKANIFLTSGAYKSAAEEMALVAEKASRTDIRGEAQLRQAMSVYYDGRAGEGADLLRQIVTQYRDTDVAARAQFLLGEVLFSEELYEDAIIEYNRVLADYFEHSLAARAQYRIGRSLDAIGRGTDATSTYQAVVSGYPMSPESPAAAYLAGVGLIDQRRPQAAIPYFQLVLDRYARDDSTGMLVFASEDHRELVEASLCLLEYSYHLTGNLGQLSGVPHLMLQKMPQSKSPWRAYALLIDADALAAQARYPEAEAMLKQLVEEFPGHSIAVPANRLLAWTYAQQGKDDLAIETEEAMLARYGSYDNEENLSSAYLNKANILFNRKSYADAAASYDEFLRRFPGHPKRLHALYQAGLCYQLLDQSGDAVDRWEALVAADSTAEMAERALVRAGDLYFRADYYDDAKRCYRTLLEYFAESRTAALGMLRIAQCEYNAGNDEEALKLYSDVLAWFSGTPIATEAERGIELTLYRLGQREDGSEVLAHLVEQYPASSFAADAQFEIAMRSYQAERFDEAAEEFRRVVSQFPGYSAADRAHYLMADSYRQSGAARDAQLAYGQFLSFFPDSEFRAMVHFRLGSLRFEEGDYLRAAIDFTSVLDAAAPEEISAAALFNLALCKRVLGESEEALAMLGQYRQRYPAGDERTVDIAYHRGDIHEKAGRTEQAIEEYKRALNAKPSGGLSIELWYRIGLCREQLGNSDRAITAYRNAMAANDKDDSFRLLAVARCAGLYEDKEDFGNALAAYRELIKHSTDEELVIAAKERASQLEAILK